MCRSIKFLLCLVFFAPVSLYAQGLSYTDRAVQMTQTDVVGTARIQAIGGAATSLGGDMSAAYYNPAGLGFFRRSEFNIGMGMNVKHSSADYTTYSFSSGNFNTENTTADNSKFQFTNMGLVISQKKDDLVPGKWRGGSFAVTFNRMRDYSGTTIYRGSNAANDINDFFVQGANDAGITDINDLIGDPSLIGMAADVYLLDSYIDQNGDQFIDRLLFNDVPSEQFPVRQQEAITRRGNQNTWNFAYGGNFDDILFIGVGVGIVSTNYYYQRVYTEQYDESELTDIRLGDEYHMRSTGINANFGLIFKPIPQINIGASVTTPTYNAASDMNRLNLTANFNNYEYDDGNSTVTLNNQVADPLQFNSDFRVTTPWRSSLGASVFLGKFGFLSADAEYVDYSSISFSSNQFDMTGDNANVDNQLGAVWNFRAGAEFRIGQIRLRGGYNFQQDPYTQLQNNIADYAVHTVSGGIGYRDQAFSVDFVLLNSQRQGVITPYDLYESDGSIAIDSPYALDKMAQWRGQINVGFFF